MDDQGIGYMLFRGVRVLLVLLGGIAGWQISNYIQDFGWWPAKTLLPSLGLTGGFIIVFALIGMLLTPVFIRSLSRGGLIFEKYLQSVSWLDISVGIAGLIIGLLVANLLALPFTDLPAVGTYIAVLLNITLGYVFTWVFFKRREDVISMMSSVGGFWRGKLPRKTKRNGEYVSRPARDVSLSHQELPVIKILDTSVIIDGRILDIARAGFLDGVVIMPRFILVELQGVADSSDPVRRGRGRKGLDVINELQKIPNFQVEMVETTLADLDAESVDLALVALARELDAKIITTDYNLNKVAQIQGITVLNVNDLANALKPMLLPGETVTVDVIREGKESHQGVGYLDDGTMIVVEDGAQYVNQRVDVVVTSMLQTSAGRMIFGRLRHEE
ncbi:MAG TPA: twitching motility protein PilT [Synergistaceae bacterium]|nr:twitching motility protein PilT [Synergistaceae bacterium]HPJ25227.1 twitching motility protein PilT [Synergistaceae bacterium]HPQ36098.1 twitching motility protein PilT [Synergistaceae bacterium]